MTACARCGDCCERITISHGSDTTAEGILDHLAAQWATYGEDTDQAFILRYWDLIPGTEDQPWFTCQWFDPVARTCGTHDNLPGVCSGFPWYKDEVDDVGDDFPWRHVSKRCSFLADVINRMAVGG